MIPRELYDYVLILELKSLKDLLRLVRFFSEKTKRKLPLYKYNNTLFTVFRRKLASEKKIAIIAETNVKSGKILEKNILYYDYHKDKVLVDIDLRQVGNEIILEEIVVESYEHFPKKKYSLLDGLKSTDLHLIHMVSVSSWEDLVRLAFLSRDLLIRAEVDNEAVMLLTGLLSHLFIPVELFLTIFYALTDRTNINMKANYVEIGDNLKFLRRVSLRVMRFIPIINTRGITLYED